MCENMNYHQVKPVPFICPCQNIHIYHISVLKASDMRLIVTLIYFRPYSHDTYVNLAIRIWN